MTVVNPSNAKGSAVLEVVTKLLPTSDNRVCMTNRQQRKLVRSSPSPIKVNVIFRRTTLFSSLAMSRGINFLLCRRSALPQQRVQRLIGRILSVINLPNVNGHCPTRLSKKVQGQIDFTQTVVSGPSGPRSQPTLLLCSRPATNLSPVTSAIVRSLVHGVRRNRNYNSCVVIARRSDAVHHATSHIVFLRHNRVR